MKVNTDPLRMEEGIKWTSSKGNQDKWFENGIWYKADGLGYEALAEVLISRLLKKTNVNQFVCYEYEPLEKGKKIFCGCKSEDFMSTTDERIISIERLFQTYTGKSAAKAILEFTEIEDRIKYVTECVENFTGLTNFSKYLKKVITIDTLFLNEDRHFHNLAVIQKKDGTFRECPIFDNGAALFSDVRGDYPLEMDLEQCYNRIEAKPFAVDFDMQLDAVEMLYGGWRFHAEFTMKDVDMILEEFQGIYEEAVIKRVQQVMRMQMRKYAYLF